MLGAAQQSIGALVYGWCTPAVLFLIVNIVIGSIAVASKCSSHHHHHFADDGRAYPAGRFLSRSLSRSSSFVLERLHSFNLHRYSCGEIHPPGDAHASSDIASEGGAGAHPGRSLVRCVSRSSSIFLDRLSSFNVGCYSSGEIHPPVAAHASSEIASDGGPGAHPGRSLVRSVSRSSSIVLERLRSFGIQHYLSGAQIPPSAADHETEAVGEVVLPETATEQVRVPEHNDLVRSQSDMKPTAGEAPPKLAVRMKKSASEKSPFAHFEEAEVEETMDPAEGDEGSEVDARADDFINRFRQQLKLQRLNSILRYKEMISRGANWNN